MSAVGKLCGSVEGKLHGIVVSKLYECGGCAVRLCGG